MNAMQNFAFEENLVRVIELDGEPWFVGKDVCAALGIRDHHQALEKLDDDERGGCVVPTPMGEQAMIVVSEPGVYRLVFRSNKPEAERFKRWLAHEVLPAIRKTGSYGAPVRPAEAAIVDPLAVDRRQALAEVREARLIFGPRAARALWNQSPYLPRVPEMDLVMSSGGDEGPECLGYLLGFMVDEDMRSIADLLQSGETAALERVGLKPVDGGVWLDPSKPEMKALWKRTRWRDGLWISHLRRLPGVTGNHPRMSIGGHQCRPLWLPASLLMA